jgi:hypothetical protein
MPSAITGTPYLSDPPLPEPDESGGICMDNAAALAVSPPVPTEETMQSYNRIDISITEKLNELLKDKESGVSVSDWQKEVMRSLALPTGVDSKWLS